MSAFTALNGGSPKASDLPKPATPEARQSPPSERAKPSAPLNAQSSAGDVSASQGGSIPGSSNDRPSYQEASYPDIETSHKRKRSDSPEVRRERDPQPMQERTPDTATQPHPPESRDPYGTPLRDRERRRHSEETTREHGDSWHSREGREDRSYDEHLSASSTQGQTEEHIAEALRRVAGQMEGQDDYGNTSPDGDDRSLSVYDSVTPGGGSRDPMLQSDPKKRKRNFSNRTKTGCLTCRKRKKKCDEQKPECINCIRGGFLCAGYPPQRGTGWQKPDSKSSAVPLESKDPSYVPPGAYGMPQMNTYSNQSAGAQRREPIPPYARGQPLRIDPPQGRQVANEDDRPTASTIPSASVTSPEHKLSALPYTPQNVFPTPVSAQGPGQQSNFSDRKEYQRVPPLHEVSRAEPETPHPGNTLPQINILQATRTSSPGPNTTSASNAQVAAQLALSHTQFPGNRPRTQKEEMLSGRHYYPFDKELVLERERCSAACWRFNNSTNPNNGVSPNERARLFREILQPRDPIQISPTLASPVTNIGRVGDDVVVEAPFTCDYGYNITIGQNVLIGRNCTIIDTCEVRIGDNCHVGPNVNIYTATLPIDPKRRMGSKGPQLGRGITIEQDCWIGGGAMILPGRTIGKGSTVGAGAIVTKDVPPFTIVVGNPARVLRGISS